MKNIIFYGAPGAGKGTQCELLINEYGYKQISTGELFRNLDDSNPLARQIKETIAKGILIDDETTAALVKQEIEKHEGNPIILDGFPRTLNQAKMLDNFFSNYIVINIDIDKRLALERALGRISCSKCGRIYNKYSKEMKPQKDNICDDCNVSLIGRDDDNEDSFNKRFNTYLDNVKGILEFYQSKDVLFTVEANESKYVTFDKVKKILGE